jgi:Fe2+ or Zn2+ uptake regulation protein
MPEMQNSLPSEYYEIIRDKGGRVTAVVSTILLHLYKSRKIFSPQQLKDAVNRILVNDIGLPTIYRNLDRLMQAGLIYRMYRDDGQTFFYACRHPQHQHHHHFICTVCCCVQEIDMCIAAQYEKHMADEKGLFITKHIIQFEGICKDCQRKKEEKVN